jgi:hypothetical protein
MELGRTWLLETLGVRRGQLQVEFEAGRGAGWQF